MLPRQLFEENLSLIERTIVRACRRAGLVGADAEDFASTVKIALIENDYAVLRAWEQRSSLATYLAVIVQRLLADEQIRAYGRWHASARAKTLGEMAVMIETLLCRRGRSIEEILPIVQAVDPSITRARIEEIAAQLPERTRRPRVVELDENVPVAASDRTDTRIFAEEAKEIAERAASIVRSALDQLPEEDQTLIWFRFGSGMSVADIARMTRLPQRPLYRRLESLLGRLRGALAKAGIDASVVGDAGQLDLDLGLGGLKR